MQNKLLLLLLSGMLSSLAVAADAKPQATCHNLMTEKECSEHITRLAALPPGEALDRYLAEYAGTRMEREAACRCTHALSRGKTTPLHRQALLGY
jgi:hypothetical protein